MSTHRHEQGEHMTERGLRSYLFALADGGGTVPPELAVVRRLVDRGHRVRVLAEHSMQREVRRTGAEFLPPRRGPGGAADAPAHSDYRDWELRSPLALARGMADHMIAGPARDLAEELLPHLRSERPDLVVTSFVAFGAMAAAQSADVPFDVLVPNIYPMPTTGQPPMGMGLKPARTAVGRLRDRLLDQASTRTLGHYALPRLNGLRGDLGLPDVQQLWDQVHAARRQLVLSSRAFDFPRGLRTSVRYVGPMLDDPGWADHGPAVAADDPHPLVLVALSSTYQGQRQCVQNVIDALASLPVRGLVTTGPGLDPGELRASERVEVVRSASHREVMGRADLVVTHGGHGTVMKSLVAGRPLVILPHGRDQPDNAVRVGTRGAGLTVSRRASPERIADAVREVLAVPGFREAAARLGARIQEEIVRSRLLTELESL